MATPVAPTAPTATFQNVATPLRTINIANGTELTAFLAGTDTLGGGGSALGPPQFGDDVVLTVAGTYAPTSNYTLPVPTGSVGGGSGFITVTSRPASATRPVASVRTAVSTRPTIASAAENYVTIRSANSASLPSSTVAVADASNMPTITASDPASSFVNGPFAVSSGAHHYRLLGLNIIGPAAATAATLIQLEQSSPTTNNSTNDVIIDRCLVHGASAYGANQGVSACGADISVINSRVYDIWKAGQENHGILFHGGPGPFLVDKCEVAADGANIFIGDSSVVIPGVIPSNITITNNWIHKPDKWCATTYIYNTGTAAISANGLTITLTGATVDSGWVGKYFTLKESANLDGNGYLVDSRLISAVNVGASTLTLSSAFPVLTGTSGKNYRITLWEGVVKDGSMKNLIESKHGKIMLFQNNLIDLSPQAGQDNALPLVSVHGNGGGGSDINFYQNYVKRTNNCIEFLTRPVVGTGTQFTISNISAAAGTGLVKITANSHLGTTGDTAELNSVGGTTEANGVWTITVLDANNFTIPVTFVHAWTSGGACNIWQSGFPTARIAITENVFEDVGSKDAVSPGVARKVGHLIPINISPDLTGSVPGDVNLSSTGSWNPSDFLFAHNTVVGPTGGDDVFGSVIQFQSGSALVDSGSAYKFSNFTLRDNVCKAGSSNFASNSFNHKDISGSIAASGTAALDKGCDTSRSFTNNAFFEPSIALATQRSSMTAGTDTNNAWLTDRTYVGVTSYTAGSLTGYALSDIWTGTCTVSAANPAVITLPSVNFPAYVDKGTPFKVNSNGTFVLVASRDSATQLTLASTYPTTGSGLTATLTFKGWATDGADIGCNVTALNSALANVPS